MLMLLIQQPTGTEICATTYTPVSYARLALSLNRPVLFARDEQCFLYTRTPLVPYLLCSRSKLTFVCDGEL
eukprot:COSAG03_NODE_1691_length_3644_cov_1.491961_2_plen_71_part_00